MGGRLSRVRVYFLVSCVYFISQMLNIELWTCYVADYIWQALWGASHHFPLSRTDIVPIKL